MGGLYAIAQERDHYSGVFVKSAFWYIIQKKKT